jgi:hypothetical protein
MKISELEKLYDFTESEVTNIEWKREYRDLVIKMSGIWHRGRPMPAYGTPVKLTLINCI